MIEQVREPRVVVGAAVVRRGRLLAARRKPPSPLAGGWELPGGKVEPGESEIEALVRECQEELGVEIAVGERVGPETPLGSGYVLRVWFADLVAGEPSPIEDHDELRWLSPEELDDVDWLAADRPAVAALRAHLLAGRPLPGGNVGGAVQVGDTVRRPTGPWTPAVHALLRHLDTAGLDGVPRVLGIDEQEREILTYLPGETVGAGVWPEWAWSDGLLVQVMSWLRRYHDVVEGWRPPEGAVWRSGTVWEPGLVICHNDVAPYNLVVDLVAEGPRLRGVVDWDVAGPGRRLDDVAFAAWNFVPLRPIDGHFPDEDVRQARLRLMADTYGVPAGDVAAAVVPRMRSALDRIERGAAAGDEGLRRLIDNGEVADQRKWIDAFTPPG